MLVSVIAIICNGPASKVKLFKYFGSWCTFFFKFLTKKSPIILITALGLIRIWTLNSFPQLLLQQNAHFYY
jgi:hypothetical protein